MKKFVFVCLAMLSFAANANNKCFVCHYPPGNPGNVNVLSPDCSAVPAHLNHGDVQIASDDARLCPKLPLCENGKCGVFDEAHFDFFIHSGGIRSDLFVCKVGMKKHECKDNTACDKGADYISVNMSSGDPVIVRPGQVQTFGPTSPFAKSADVFLNSINYGAGWFVEYCHHFTRAIVGDPDLLKLGVIDYDIDVIPGYHNGYFGKSGLVWKKEFKCEDKAESPLNILFGDNEDLEDGEWDGIEGYQESNRHQSLLHHDEEVKCFTKKCKVRISFREKARCVREIKDVKHCGGDIKCEVYHADVHTKVKATLNCENGDCPKD